MRERLPKFKVTVYLIGDLPNSFSYPSSAREYAESRVRDIFRNGYAEFQDKYTPVHRIYDVVISQV